MRILASIAAALWLSVVSATEFKPDATQQLTLATALPLSAEMQQLQQQSSRSMENKVNLYGASGHCKVIIDALISSGVAIDTIVDDNPKSELLLGLEIKRTENFNWNGTSPWILSIGNNLTRKRISEK